MAALSNIVRATTEASELVPTESIRALLSANYAPRVSDSIVNLYVLGPGQGRTVAVPKQPDTTITSGSTIAEGEDAITVTAWDPAEITLTVARHGIDRAITEESDFFSVHNVQDAVLMSSMNALFDKKDKYVLGQFVNATNSYNGQDAAFDVSAFDSALATFKAQNPVPGLSGFACVLHNDQFRDLLDSVGASGAGVFANPMGGQGDLGGMFSGVQGAHGMFHGIQLLESANVPAYNATNWEGAMLSAGGGDGALALAVADLEGTGLGFSVRITGPGSLPAQKYQRYVGVNTWIESAIVNQANILSIQSQT